MQVYRKPTTKLPPNELISSLGPQEISWLNNSTTLAKNGYQCIENSVNKTQLEQCEWIQCDSCNKWRRITNAEYIKYKPEEIWWRCSINLDTEYNNCNILQEKTDEEIENEINNDGELYLNGNLNVSEYNMEELTLNNTVNKKPLPPPPRKNIQMKKIPPPPPPRENSNITKISSDDELQKRLYNMTQMQIIIVSQIYNIIHTHKCKNNYCTQKCHDFKVKMVDTFAHKNKCNQNVKDCKQCCDLELYQRCIDTFELKEEVNTRVELLKNQYIKDTEAYKQKSLYAYNEKIRKIRTDNSTKLQKDREKLEEEYQKKVKQLNKANNIRDAKLVEGINLINKRSREYNEYCLREDDNKRQRLDEMNEANKRSITALFPIYLD